MMMQVLSNFADYHLKKENSLFLEKNNLTFVFFLLVNSECLSIFQKVDLKELLDYY